MANASLNMGRLSSLGCSNGGASIACIGNRIDNGLLSAANLVAAGPGSGV